MKCCLRSTFAPLLFAFPFLLLARYFIEDDDHLLTVARYVEGNPVRAGLVETATAWNWSSHRERCGLEREKILAPFPIDPTRGLAPPGACPRDEHGSAGACPRSRQVPEGDSPSFEKGLSPSAVWTAFVDTPLTARELAKVKRKIERQTGEGDRLLH